jgi:hypothetical protein
MNHSLYAFKQAIEGCIKTPIDSYWNGSFANIVAYHATFASSVPASQLTALEKYLRREWDSPRLCVSIDSQRDDQNGEPRLRLTVADAVYA